MEPDDAPTLKTGDAARLLGVRVRELYELIDRSDLPAYKVGRTIMLRQSDVDAYRREHPAGG